jgi:hypothetical protein
MPGGIQLNPGASGSGDCCCGSVGNCSPCSIPEHNLTLTAVRQVDHATFTTTLVFNATTMTWRSAADPSVRFGCGPKVGSGAAYGLWTVDNPDDVGGELYHAADTTCEPFHVHFTCGSSYFGCPCPPGTAPCYDFYVDG